MSGNRTLHISQPEITCLGPHNDADTFKVSLKLINTGEATHALEKMRVEYKLLNDVEWRDAQAPHFEYKNPFPLFVGPRDIVEVIIFSSSFFSLGILLCSLQGIPRGPRLHSHSALIIWIPPIRQTAVAPLIWRDFVRCECASSFKISRERLCGE